jgi:hypothetical protein
VCQEGGRTFRDVVAIILIGRAAHVGFWTLRHLFLYGSLYGTEHDMCDVVHVLGDLGLRRALLLAVEANGNSEENEQHASVGGCRGDEQWVVNRHIGSKETGSCQSRVEGCHGGASLGHVHAGRWGFSPSSRLVVAVKTNVSELQMGTALEMSAKCQHEPQSRTDEGPTQDFRQHAERRTC